MSPAEVILENLDDRWSFEGDCLVFRDSEGGFTRVAQVSSKRKGYPVRVEFLESLLPEVVARDESDLKTALINLSQLEAFRRMFSPLP